MPEHQVARWPSGAKGRSRSVAYGNVVWTVANAIDTSAGFEAQAIESLRMLESHLLEAGSARTHLLSVQVILSDIGNRGAFEPLWQEWIGSKPEHWPQRACFQSALATGLLLELVAIAAPASAGQAERPASPSSGMNRSSREVSTAMAGQFALPSSATFALGDRVRKKSGAAWQGRVVGWYCTSLTAEGYAVESGSHPGSVQIYPVAALERVP